MLVNLVFAISRSQQLFYQWHTDKMTAPEADAMLGDCVRCVSVYVFEIDIFVSL